MRVIYNGIDMRVLELEQAVVEPVYDSTQTDLLYCRYLLSVNVMVNGQAEVRNVAGPPLSYAKTGNQVYHYDMQTTDKPPAVVAPVPPFASAPDSVNPFTIGLTAVDVTSGTDPVNGNVTGGIHAFNERAQVEIVPGPGPTAITHQLLYSRLVEPRAILWVFNNDGGPDDLILQSHAFDQYCDARNGPIPAALNITRAFGDGATFFLNFQVQTFVDLHQYADGNPETGLVSNRFGVTHTIDEDGVLEIHVRGEAHFKANFLYDAALSADFFRRSLFLPVPFGHVRGNIVVEGMENACGVRYSYTDREMPVHFVAGPYADATRIEAVHRQSIGSNKDIFGTALDVYERDLGIRVNRRYAREDNHPTPKPPGKGGPGRPGRIPPPSP
jgi:hypothetical protein